MLRASLPAFFLCVALNSTAQNYGNVWQFGYDVGLDFNDCDPQVITGANAGFEGCAAVCGPNGQVLFYTNSETVWNSLHDPMPNGGLNPNGYSLSQVLVVQVPQSDSLYYIVTTTVQASHAGELNYHVVDMTEAGGLGDVISSGNLLFAGMSTEHVAATRHANGVDVWIMAHEYPGNNFLAYQLTPTGIAGPPVISGVGTGLLQANSNMNTRGEIKFSMDGSRVAISGNGEGTDVTTNLLGLYHFDTNTGVVSDPLELPFERGDFGISFSPDGSKLYGATWKAFNFMSTDNNTLYQFDLSSGDSATIVNSKQILLTTSTSEPFGSLKLGPDGRIYMAANGRDHLGVINHPNLPAPLCDYVHNGLYLNGAMTGFGLNNYIEYVYCDPYATAMTAPRPSAQLTLFPNPTQGAISIRGAGAEKISSILLTDLSGRVALFQPVNGGSAIDLSGLSPGGYEVMLTDVVGNTLFCGRVAVL
ncbi:MAG: T9SS type A sorting domain-containing protein [Flavobacteriales bacterium]|nr:T9SS type A sorting domain-containing protein [Flavobacteriales bacterium]MBP6697772.1 T9SS type A sorting domain-containing protein [Flavobacteriales bacterium]